MNDDPLLLDFALIFGCIYALLCNSLDFMDFFWKWMKEFSVTEFHDQ